MAADTSMRPCPFCKATEQSRSRFDYTVLMDDFSVIGTLESEKKDGDMFCIKCKCGCRLEKHVDELVDLTQDRLGYDVEIKDEDIWNTLISIWNGSGLDGNEKR